VVAKVPRELGKLWWAQVLLACDGEQAVAEQQLQEPADLRRGESPHVGDASHPDAEAAVGELLDSGAGRSRGVLTEEGIEGPPVRCDRAAGWCCCGGCRSRSRSRSRTELAVACGFGRQARADGLIAGFAQQVARELPKDLALCHRVPAPAGRSRLQPR
jgi:hypothetical protein